MNWDDENYEFPGWPLRTNPHGKEFDKEARKRMISGSETLLPYIYQFKKEIKQNILEIGPFFNPLITYENFPDKNICYWENDHHVLKWLERINKEHNIEPIFCDLNKIEGDSLIKVKQKTNEFFIKHNAEHERFDAVILSQIFNYVDYQLLLIIIKNFLKKDGLIFINNVKNYGLPKFFSKKRPKSIEETIKTVEDCGYEIILKEQVSSPYPENQKEDRLILVAKNL